MVEEVRIVENNSYLCKRDERQAMNTVVSIFLQSMGLVICLFCGWLMWRYRREVPDRSRLILAVICFTAVMSFASRLVLYATNSNITPYYYVLSPFHLYVGLFVLTVYIAYPLEMMHPRLLSLLPPNRYTWLLFAPFLLSLVPLLCGLKFQELSSFSDSLDHLYDFDIILRLFMALCLVMMSFVLLFIPYNWRETSAYRNWILRFVIIAFITCLLLFGQIFSQHPIFHFLHLPWFSLSIAYFTYNELQVRLVPVGVPESLGDGGDLSVVENKDLWQQVSYLMDIKEYWRNPNTTVVSVSQTLGTNRIYVSRCIKEHTGMTFNDYMNSKRVDFMANLLRQNPTQNQKQLFFAAGFRSYPTAHRNFVKFKGCSATEYVGKFS